MCKKWGYYVRSVCVLCCIFCMVFLSTLHVSASTASKESDLLGSRVCFDSWVSAGDITVNLEPTSNCGLSSATVTLDSSTSGHQGYQSQTLALSGTLGGNTSSRSGYYYPTTGSVSLSGSNTASSINTTGSAVTSGRDYSETGNLSGSISFTGGNNNSCTMHVRIPYKFLFTKGNTNPIYLDKYYAVFLRPSINTSTIPQGAVISNIACYDSKYNLISTYDGLQTNNKWSYFLGSELLCSSDEYLGFFGFLEFDLFFSSFTSPQQVTLRPVYYDSIYNIKDSYQSYVSGSNATSDTVTHKELNDMNKTEKDTNTTTHSIFDSITAFFGSFFSNLIGVFVPEDGYFTTWFNNLNQLLTDKLGILYYPFSVIINFFNRCTTAFSSQGSGTDIVFPAIEFTNVSTGETYTFLQAQHINLADYNVTTSASANSTLVGSSGFGSLVDIIRTFNAFVILFCLLSLLRTKLNLILRGDNNDN